MIHTPRMSVHSILATIIIAAICAPGLAAQAADGLTSALQLEQSYQDILKEYRLQGYADVQDEAVHLQATDYADRSQGAIETETGIGERDDPVLAWRQEDTWVEYEFSVGETGLYCIQVEYFPLPGKRGPVQREVLIDGSYPFREAKSLDLPRIWDDEGEPEKDNQGNDVRPRQIQIPMWRTAYLEDPEGMARDPLRFYLTAGTHTLRMVALKEPVALATISIVPPPEAPSYQEVLAEYRAKGYSEVEDAEITVQAEHASYKSDPTVRMEYSSDIKAVPAAGSYRVLNVLGGYRWRRGNQFVTWGFSVDKPGLYKIGMSIVQNYNSGLPTVRRVEIDGSVPFQELKEELFPFSRLRQYYYLGGNEEPYLFYLDEGQHTLTMTAKIGPVRSVIDTIERTVRDISKLQRDIILLTGVDPDPNREWDILPEDIPYMIPTFLGFSEELGRQANILLDIAGGGRPPAINVLKMASEQFQNLADKPETVPYRLEDISQTLSNLISWILGLKEQPLEIDFIEMEAPDNSPPRVRPNFFERLAATWNAYILSYRKEYTGVGDYYTEEEKPLTVWIARGREWVEILKEMADEDFTPETGIKINTNVLPANQMQAILLNAIARTAPDVVLAMDPILPVDYGIRGALANLNEFPDYEEVIKRFRPGALVPFHFRGEDFALPENQNFSMLFYRTDIMQELGLSVPQSWSDVYDIIPELQKHGMDFFYAGVAAVPGQVHNGLLPFLLQRGGEFYTEDQLSALDTPEALAAFKQWTELYTNWKVPMVANFYNRFRTGEIPVGISQYNSYVQLKIGAPELEGWWKMAPIPGLLQPDGTVDRSAGGVGQAAVIFKQSDQKEEAWEFLKWWTSTEVQTRYAEELEALIGLEARWNTSNVEALKSLPWPNEDIEAILKQWDWFKEQPIVLGGYFTQRHVQFAWTRVVLQGENPREALELAYQDINRELRRKQEEFGFSPPKPPEPDLPPAIEKLVEGEE